MEEKELFKEIRNNRKHICNVCGKKIYKPRAYCFAHILPKGVYRDYKFDSRNISLVCSIDCHNKCDTIVGNYYYIVRYMLDKGIEFNINMLSNYKEFDTIEEEVLFLINKHDKKDNKRSQ